VTKALVMAGGRGERMHATGTSTPKPLVSIQGVPLLERNVLALLQSEFRDITVATPSHTPEIAHFASGRCRALAAMFGGRLSLLEETHPLGNIGAAAEIETGEDDLLIVYADNLTSIDLNALVDHHRHAGAALTSAVHLEPFRIHFGEVEVQDGEIVAYLEKPERRILVSSGLFVMSPKAVSYIPRGQHTAVSWLVNRLLAAGEKIAAFPHDAPWIDVNDRSAVGRAEQLLTIHAKAFEPQDSAPNLALVVPTVDRSANRRS
jgi:NDP-sugar pyrophosphorylase family protein